VRRGASFPQTGEMDRGPREHLIAANNSRQQMHRIRASIGSDGRILAIDDEFFHDQGAYMRTHAATVPDLAAAMLPGPYRVPAYRAVGHIRLTNKTPGGTYRAPGRFESTFVRERLLDAIAAKVGIDAVEARRRNLIAAVEMPYARPIETLGTNVTFDSGDYPALLDKTLAAMNWAELRADVQRRRSAGEAVGIGLAMFVEKSGLGPFDGVRVTIDTSGAVEVVTGAASIGQGVETVIAQICADALRVDYRRIRVVHGQTDQIAYGMGAFASHVTVMTGEAARLAALKVRAKAIQVAAELLQAPPDSLDVVDGKVIRTGADAGPSVGLGAWGGGASSVAGVEVAGRAFPRADGRWLVPHPPHELPLRRACRPGAGGSRDRCGERAALRDNWQVA
jgi:carbon-monoxide dehydrogenase large subunit/6-hydroxypseudooxynicotine dehydrogenase subunit gamma